MSEPAGSDDPPEISDLVVSYDPETLARRDVHKEAVIAELSRHRMRGAVAVVSGWPAEHGVLDRHFVDGVLLRSHLEMQRLSEEFQQGARMARLLRPMIDALGAQGVPRPYRVVDVGAGLGYVTRWLAATNALGEGVELIGCDYNAALVGAATRLARREGLRCRFLLKNAFALEEPATIYTSTGVIHHFRGRGLPSFFEEQARSGAYGFVHCDIKPSKLAPVGAWIFHRARMREPLARVDGVLSAVRAHPGERLLAAATRAFTDLAISLFDGQREDFSVLRVMQAILGVRAGFDAAFMRALGPLGARLTKATS